MTTVGTYVVGQIRAVKVSDVSQVFISRPRRTQQPVACSQGGGARLDRQDRSR